MKILFTYFKVLTTLLLLLGWSAAFSQVTVTVTGKVTEAETGDPLIGVSILLLESATGTVTDFEGNYAIEVPSQESVLRFSYVGYAPVER